MKNNTSLKSSHLYFPWHVIVAVIAACTFLLFGGLLLGGCSGGGGDSDSSPPLQTSACAQLGLNTRIINGTECSEANSPIVKLIINTSDGLQGICSGTLITPTHVLTAAHCFFSSVGATTVSVAGQTVTAAQITNHPALTIDTENSRINNDAAIVRLSQPLTGVAILPIVGTRQPNPGETISIFGYGKTELDQPGTLRSGEMRINQVLTTHIRAKYDGEGSNTCFGDSGGPAVLSYLDESGQEVDGIVGVVSSGILPSCQTGDETFFTNITSQSVFDFITDVVPPVTVR